MLRALPRARSLLRHMSSVESNVSSTSALVQFSTCELSDALIKLGVPHGGHIPDVYRQSSYEGSATERICGPAYTVQMVSASETNAPKLEKHFVDTAENGCIVVIDAPPR